MTPEERFERIERQWEFLANHQAELFASLEALKEADQRHLEQIAKHSDQIAKHSEQIAQLSALIGGHTDQIGQLADLVLRIGRVVEEQGRRTEKGFERLTQAQQRTDERLNALIGVVERYFSDGRR